MTYSYNGDGKRVQKSNGFSGKRTDRVDLPSGTVHYYFSDHLGSADVVTNATGTTIEEESDYYPYGGERAIIAGANTFKFTGKERDTESGLDYFGTRYYASPFGRFITPDSFGNDWEIVDPQRWNLYTYVRNNPLSYVDDFGEELTIAPELQATVATLRTESTSIDTALKGFQGKGAPDLSIGFGDAGYDADGKTKAIGVTKAKWEGGPVSTCSDETHCVTEDRDWVLKSAGISVDDSLKRDQSEIESVLEHEIGHANEDRTEPNQAKRESEQTKETKGKVPWNQRPEERKANEFRDKAKAERKQFKEQQKAEERRRRQEEKKKKKQKRGNAP